MTDSKNETAPKNDELLYNLNHKITSALPDSLQKLQVAACDHVGSKYPQAACQGVRDAVTDAKSR